MNKNIKPSGIEWIGDIPGDWEVKKLKYLSTLKGRIGWQGLTSDEYTDEGSYLITGIDFNNGAIDWDRCVHVSIDRWSEAKDIQVKNGDLLITKDGTVGKVAVVSGLTEKASLNSGVLLINTYEIYSRKYLFWVLQSDVFWLWFNFKNAGNSTIIHLYQNDFKEFAYSFPIFSEQQAIANLLDEKCSKTDNIISDLQKQIEILKQYKKSLITETVTKGLDKTVPMKDSGIEWIGEIPEHWRIIKLSYIFTLFAGGDISEDDFSEENDETYPYPVFSNSLADNGLFGFSKKYRFSGNSITVTGRGDVGFAISRIVKYYPIIRLLVCIPKNKSNTRYYAYCINSSETTGEQTAMAQLTTLKLGSIKVPLPPLPEQKSIANYLDKKCTTIDTIISEKEKAIETMQSYKKSLIYEYVTGKKQVQGEQ